MYLFDCNSGEFVEKETLLRSEQNETKIEIFLTIDNRKKIVFLKFDDGCLILVKR